MNVIDSPVDALVFDYVRIGIFTVVNNLWTWVAVITAAVSFWRIRAGASPPAVESASSCAVEPEAKRSTAVPARANREPIGFCPPAAPAETSRPGPANEPSSLPSSSPAAAVSSFCEDSVMSVTKGKFVVYYEDERRDDGDSDGDSEGETAEWDNGEGCGEWWESWEKVLRVRTGEMEWYRYQDLTAINGNVVRLWDGVRRDSLVW